MADNRRKLWQNSSRNPSMKPFLITASLSFAMVFGMLYAAHGKFSVTYEQVFAEKHIVLTEKMTLSERFFLPNKKGFVRYVR